MKNVMWRYVYSCHTHRSKPAMTPDATSSAGLSKSSTASSSGVPRSQLLQRRTYPDEVSEPSPQSVLTSSSSRVRQHTRDLKLGT